jgi:xylulokinase
MLLGLDLGTTNIKALVTDFGGNRLGEGVRPIQRYGADDGEVEQDLEEIWQAALEAIRLAVRNIIPGGIKAIGVSSQGGALQLLDVLRRPVGRVISWLDRRGQPFDRELTNELGHEWFAKRIGHRHSGLAIGQLLRLRHEQSTQLARPNRIGFVGDIIVSRLCGCPAHDGTSGGLTLLYNPALRHYEPELLSRLEITPDQLPELLLPNQPAGGLLPEIASQIGLRKGIPVSAAIHDQYCGALAARTVQAGMVMIGTGTTWVLLIVSDHLAAPATPDAFVCHHLIEGAWGQIVSLINGGSALTRALEQTGQNVKSVPEIDALMESVPAARLTHQSGHVIRSAVEGLAFELKQQMCHLRQSKLPVEKVVLSGRAAASRVIPQILSTVTGLPIACAGRGGGSPLGAAIIARGLLEPGASLSDLAAAMAPASRETSPEHAAGFYHEQFDQYLRSLQVHTLTQ